MNSLMALKIYNSKELSQNIITGFLCQVFLCFLSNLEVLNRNPLLFALSSVGCEAHLGKK